MTGPWQCFRAGVPTAPANVARHLLLWDGGSASSYEGSQPAIPKHQCEEQNICYARGCRADASCIAPTPITGRVIPNVLHLWREQCRKHQLCSLLQLLASSSAGSCHTDAWGWWLVNQSAAATSHTHLGDSSSQRYLQESRGRSEAWGQLKCR